MILYRRCPCSDPIVMVVFLLSRYSTQKGQTDRRMVKMPYLMRPPSRRQQNSAYVMLTSSRENCETLDPRLFSLKISAEHETAYNK